MSLDERDALRGMLEVYDTIVGGLDDRGQNWNGFRSKTVRSIFDKVAKARRILEASDEARQTPQA